MYKNGKLSENSEQLSTWLTHIYIYIYINIFLYMYLFIFIYIYFVLYILFQP